MKKQPTYILIFYLIVFIYFGFFLSLFFPSLFTLGLYPRETWGLLGVITAPFIHASWEHLIANTIGLAIFGFIMSWLVKTAVTGIIFYIVIVCGLLTWVFAREGNHIGASGLVFGLFGYLITIGFFQRQLKPILVSIVVAAVWGGTIIGVLPSSPYVSWEAHLIGFLVGVSAARFGYRA